MGGRAGLFMNPGILVQPQNGGQLHGISQNLLDHRGRLRSGMRVYLEMRAATINATGNRPKCVSNVIWFGREDQLVETVRKGLPPKAAENVTIPEPALQPIPSSRITKGTPVWMQCGDRWTRGNALEDSNADQIRVLIYLVRRDKPYLPWVVNVPRQKLRIEQEALIEFQRDPESFRDLAETNDLKLSRMVCPINWCRSMPTT